MAQVIELQPKQDTSYLKRVIQLAEAGKIDDAFSVVNDHLLKDPNDAQALAVLSNILKRSKKLPLAYHIGKRATELKPERPEVWESFGLAAQAMWRIDEALSSHRKALQRAQTPEQKATYLNNLASALLDNGEFVKAEKPCREAIELIPTSTNSRHNLGLSLLAQRRWKEAWPWYSASIGGESRLLMKYRSRENPEPIWEGGKNQTVVVYGEQGLGDEICAASMLPDVIRDSRRVVIECDFRLAGLFKRSFPQALVFGSRWEKVRRWAGITPNEVDASIAGFEVGKFYRNSNEEFPGTPYLTPCPDRAAMWKALFKSRGKPTIGVAWTGGIFQNASLYRQLPLSEWKPIFDAIDANWVSLQYKDAAKDIQGTPVVQYPWATLTQDYDDTAALVDACDMVIGMQTTVCHLAGALGKPVWTMIPTVSQWRYGEDYTDIPWYKSMRLYRQEGDWKPTVRKIAADLAERFKNLP